MAYFAVYEQESGVIQNIVECPEFLADRIHLDQDQAVLQIEGQIVQANYLVKNNELIES
ncbi:hypothetical protein [Acinetobacter colistiniresistens]|uniref:hypothetical protein n=1 Tax=Acinetobacter colistiniresistens TaxID=280145 RepID=UPI00148F4224|nr:hypothetical protein [Acinetobacter colistiniresistens]